MDENHRKLPTFGITEDDAPYTEARAALGSLGFQIAGTSIRATGLRSRSGRERPTVIT